MVSVSASVNLPLHHKVPKFSSGTGSPGWSRVKGRKTVVGVVVCVNSQEQELKKQKELERQLEKQRQMEMEREEERRKAMEQREVSPPRLVTVGPRRSAT